MNYTKRTDFYLAIVSILTLVSTVVQAILLLTRYDPDLSLYERGTPGFLIPTAILVILLLSATVFFTLPGGKLKLPGKSAFENHDSADAPSRSIDLTAILLKIGALLLIFGAVLSGILLFYGNFSADHARELWVNATKDNAESSIKMAGTLLQCSAYVGILAAIFPAVLLITGRSSPLSALAAVIWLLLLDLSVYFDNSVILNDPCRSLEILGMSAAILWLLSEIKRMLDGAGRRTYSFVSLAAFGILCISAIPQLIATASGRLVFNSRTLIPVALLGIALMIAGRLYSLRSLPDPQPEPETESESDPESMSEPEPEPAISESNVPAFPEESAVIPDGEPSERHPSRLFVDPFEAIESSAEESESPEAVEEPEIPTENDPSAEGDAGTGEEDPQ